jgi:hypothetical protein
MAHTQKLSASFLGSVKVNNHSDDRVLSEENALGPSEETRTTLLDLNG